jgi:DNA-binding LacI/PurR family transcriptional regulator
MKVPDDMSIAGFGNIMLAEYYRVPLTTVRQPKYRLGVAAVELMMNLIHGEKAVSRRLPAEVVLRQSTAAPAPPRAARLAPPDEEAAKAVTGTLPV